MKSHVSITDAITDPNLLGACLGDPATWRTWLIALKAAFGLKLTRKELVTFHAIAGDRDPPPHRVKELWAICGRRSGKSRIAAALAVYLALLTDARSRLVPGEEGYVLVLAPSQLQARIIFRYCAAFIEASPLLRSQIQVVRQNEISLLGGVTIACHSNSFRTVRGRTLLGAIFDETAMWRDETSANPDLETYRAVLPALSTTGGLLCGIGTPYRHAGLLHQRHRDHFGQNTPNVLVLQGDSITFNPTLDTEIIAAATEDDPEGAMAEWHGEFRTDIAALLDDAMISRAVDLDRPLELPPQRGVKYHAFHDPSGGRRDASVLCIGHLERDKTFVADAVRGVPAPHDPRQATRELAALARDYGINRVTGDAYGGEWVASAWHEQRIKYDRADANRSEIYLEALPAFARGGIRLPNHSKLLKELRLLERRTHRSGRDSVDHQTGLHDDHANAVCGALWAASKKRGPVGAGKIGLIY